MGKEPRHEGRRTNEEVAIDCAAEEIARALQKLEPINRDQDSDVPEWRLPEHIALRISQATNRMREALRHLEAAGAPTRPESN